MDKQTQNELEKYRELCVNLKKTSHHKKPWQDQIYTIDQILRK